MIVVGAGRREFQVDPPIHGTVTKGLALAVTA